MQGLDQKDQGLSASPCYNYAVRQDTTPSVGERGAGLPPALDLAIQSYAVASAAGSHTKWYFPYHLRPIGASSTLQSGTEVFSTTPPLAQYEYYELNLQ